MAISTIQNASFGSDSIVNANGIKFPATQVASADANTLDDYEEGTCSIYFTDGTTNSATGTGYYVKVGGLCSVIVTLYSRSLSSLSTGHLRIAGLPFTAINGADNAVVGSITSNYPILLEIPSGNTFGYLYSGAAGADIGTITKSSFASSNASVWGEIFYRVS